MARQRKEMTPVDLMAIWFNEVKAVATGLVRGNPNIATNYYAKKDGWKELQQSMEIGTDVLIDRLDGLQNALEQFIVYDSPSFPSISQYAAMFAITEERAHKLFDAIERILMAIPAEEFHSDVFLIQVRERIGKAKGVTQDERDYVFFVVGALLSHYSAKSAL